MTTIGQPVATAEGENAPSAGAARAAPAFVTVGPQETLVGEYVESVVAGVGKLEAAFPHWTPTQAWLMWHAGWSVDDDGELFHRVAGTRVIRADKPDLT